MKIRVLNIFILLCSMMMISCTSNWQKEFRDPSNAFRPQPFFHLNGELDTTVLDKQLDDAYNLDDFGGVTLLPVSAQQGFGGGSGVYSPGTTPEFLSDEFFKRMNFIIAKSASMGKEVVLYDDLDFPSGIAGGKIAKEYPQHLTRILTVSEKQLSGGQSARPAELPVTGNYVGTVAMNAVTFERLNISSETAWTAPEGEWIILTFGVKQTGDRIDYMDEAAVDQFIQLTYEQYAKHFGKYFGTTIRKVFFDDVGYYMNPSVWNARVDELFRQRYDKDPLLYYPSLWYDMGEETEATRVAFYGIRAELIGSVFVKKLADWCEAHGLKVTGHPPGNYEPNTVQMYGDPFKFYRCSQVPLVDIIHGYPYGRPGWKLVSSVAELHDRPVTAVEIYGNYSNEETDKLMLYRAAMEAMESGINFFIPHGMWLNPDKMRITPLIMHDNPQLVDEFPAYSAFIGRSSFLLQGGRRLADIAVLFPIQSLEAWTKLSGIKKVDGAPMPDFFKMIPEEYCERVMSMAGDMDISMLASLFGQGAAAPGDTTPRKAMGIGKGVPESNDYNKVSDLLKNQIRSDFTFLHPEEFLTGIYTIGNGTIRMNSGESWQEYRLLIIPSGKVISVETLKRVAEYYRSGGKIIFTGELPVVAAEYGRSNELKPLLDEMLSGTSPNVIYLRRTTPDKLAEALAKLLPDGDVMIDPVIPLARKDSDLLYGVDIYRNLKEDELGVLSYIHKVKEGRDIYLFGNSTNTPVSTEVRLRGNHRLEIWDPRTGEVTGCQTTSTEINGQKFTVINLQLDPVEALFFVGK